MYTKEETMNVLRNPEVGDLFSEMCHFWMRVVKIKNNRIYTYERSPVKEQFNVYSRESYVKNFTYKNRPDLGCWIRLYKRGTSVDEFMDGLKDFEEDILDSYISNMA